MKKIISMFLVVAMVMCFIPLNVSAATSSTNTQWYGTLTVEESDSWQKEGDKTYITQVYSVTKTTAGGYVYLKVLEVNNVKISSALQGSAFDLVKTVKTSDGVSYLLKTRDGSEINGTKTELLTVVADIVDTNDTSCDLSYSPLSPYCVSVDGVYLDSNGKEVSATEYASICEGTTTTQPTTTTPTTTENPQTGSVIPYVAIGGGLIAIAGVYLYSRKSNKMYKL